MPQMRRKRIHLNATPSNTAVATVDEYVHSAHAPAYSGAKPETVEYFYASAKRLGITTRRIQSTFEEDTNYRRKVTDVLAEIPSFGPEFEYILFADSRDCIFLKSLDAICTTFNDIGWPMVMSAQQACVPHVDPGWVSRFGTHGSGWNYPNSGLWMCQRDHLVKNLKTLERVKEQIEAGKIMSAEKSCLISDQFVWQAAYVEREIQMRLDHERRLFGNFDDQSYYAGDFVDFERCKEPTPLVLKNGSSPAIAHFPGRASQMIPWFYKLLKLDQLDAMP